MNNIARFCLNFSYVSAYGIINLDIGNLWKKNFIIFDIYLNESDTFFSALITTICDLRVHYREVVNI